MEKMNELYFNIMLVRQCDGAYVFCYKAYGWQPFVRRVAVSNDQGSHYFLFTATAILNFIDVFKQQFEVVVI